MWSIEAEREIAAPPSSIWARYVDATTWSSWAHNTREATFPGRLELGARGRVRPERGPAQSVVITRFEPDQLLETEVRPPGARMTFGYAILPTPDGARVRHRIAMDGPMAPVYGRMIKSRNARQLDGELDRLARLVVTAVEDSLGSGDIDVRTNE